MAAPAAAQECLIRPFGDSITAGIRADLTFNCGYRQALLMDPPFVGRPIRMSGTHAYYSTPTWTRVDVVDMNTYFPKTVGMGADGIHPNDTGYWWMAQAWKQAINTVGCN